MGDLKTQLQAHTDMDGPVKGDCWRTALACLLELERDTVPHFVDETWDDDDTHAWWKQSVSFVEAARPGWTLVNLEPQWPVYIHSDISPDYVVLTGKSPRGDWNHCVVANASTGDLVHDPHPDGTGVTSQLGVAALVEI